MIKVRIKKINPKAIIPRYAKPGDAGMDITATERNLVIGKDQTDPDYIEYKTGLAFEIPKGYVGLLFPRSSNSKKDLILSNSVGVIDSGFRGELTFRYKLDHQYDDIDLRESMAVTVCKGERFLSNIYEVGDRVGQLIIIPYPEVEFEEVKELAESERSDKGYGSTGN